MQYVKELRLLVRTLNYHVSLQDFTIVFLTPLDCLGQVADALESSDDKLQIGVSNFYENDTGIKN